MIKRIVLISTISLLIISAFFGYRYLKKQQIPEFNVYKMVPTDAALIIESKNFIDKIETIKEENKIWNELNSFPELKGFDQNLDYILNISKQNELIKNLTKENQVIISAHKIGKEDIGFLL